MNFNRKMKWKFVRLAKSVKQQFQVQERLHWLQNNYYYLKQICKYWDSPILGKNPFIVCPKTISCKILSFFSSNVSLGSWGCLSLALHFWNSKIVSPSSISQETQTSSFELAMIFSFRFSKMSPLTSRFICIKLGVEFICILSCFDSY